MQKSLDDVLMKHQSCPVTPRPGSGRRGLSSQQSSPHLSGLGNGIAKHFLKLTICIIFI